MADIAVGKLVEAGLNPLSPAFQAAANGDTIPSNDGKVFLHVKNGSGVSVTVTATAVQTLRKEEGFGDLARGNIAVAVPAGEERLIGPFPPRAFNDANNKVGVGYSALTSVTVKAFRVPAV